MVDFKSKLGKKARKLLSSEFVIWLTTVDSNLTPQPRPVWFVPDGDDVLIYSKPQTAKIAHIRQHPNASLHFNTDREGGDPVMVLTGTAILDDASPLAKDFAPYVKKYRSAIADLNMSPTDFTKDYAQAIRVKITNIRGW